MSGTLTDDQILSSIPGLEEFVSNAQSDNSGETPQTETAPQSDGTDSTSSTTDTSTTGTSPTASTEQQQEVIARRDGLVEKPNADNPRSRDLVDPTTGRVVAHGGIERHVFEQAQRHRRENDTFKQRIQTLEAQVNQSNETIRVANQLQVPPQEQVAAIQAFADFKRDPVRFLETLVAEVKGRGFDIPFLSEGINRGIDTAAVSRMLDQRLAPLTAQQEQVRVNTESHNRAIQELDAFINVFPDAQMNLDVIGGVMQADPTLSLDRAYTTVLQWAHRNGLDPSQSLRQQLAQRQTGQQPQQGPAPLQPQQSMSRMTTPTAPLPNGRSASQAPVREASNNVNENSSWRQIVRDSFKEHGLQV